jgi:DNA-binding FrmR family transcriptional regulator
MTQVQTSSKTDPVVSQLKRIRGQVDGVIRMYENERTCIDIVRQIAAARSSLNRVARNLLIHEASRCSKEKNLEELDKILKEVFKH